MGQWGDFVAKSFSVKTGDLSSIPGTHRIEGETGSIPLTFICQIWQTLKVMANDEIITSSMGGLDYRPYLSDAFF